ncbi:unnamed protein product [Phytomonas sp. Hart1]|nr:unnamed protein product [Phytomonas sp. Hart1]|eukprot:CCW67089.1 unnamed protein product [Phytomonas sp. isolate Hart1]
MSVTDAADELKLVISIFQKLMQVANGQLRDDQITPLIKRLQFVLEKLQNSMVSESQKHNLHFTDQKTDIPSRPNTLPNTCSLRNTEDTHKPKNFILSKPSSLRVKYIPQEPSVTGDFAISKDVSKSFACSLYNILEGTAKLLQASSASIFMRKGDEMFSICNVSRNLVFPPIFNSHRCSGSLDAEVLASCIALNRYSSEASQNQTSMLLFPIRFHREELVNNNKAIATLHIEGKCLGYQPFGTHDESIAYFSSILIGELISRIPQIDWFNTFYEPIAQHIVAPFVPAKQVLPILRKPPKEAPPGQSSSFGSPVDAASNAVFHEVQEFVPQILIKRDVIPQKTLMPITSGLSLSPSLREVRTFVDNIHNCWRKGVDCNINYLEKEHEVQMELKELRANLVNTRKELETTKDRLRLYELDGYDYKREYKDLCVELESFIRQRNT